MTENHPEVGVAEELIESITTARSMVRQALSTLHPQFVTLALEKAAAAGFQNGESRRLLSIKETMEIFQRATEEVSEEALASALQRAAALGMPETPLTTKARTILDKIVAIKSQATTAVTPPPRGFSARHIEKLRWIVQQADTPELAGINQQASIQNVRVELERTEAELKLLKHLRDALNTGGWNKPALGDASIYEKTQLIDWSEIQYCLNECKNVGVMTEEGRWLVKWAGVIVTLRRSIKAIGADPFASVRQWNDIGNTLAENAAVANTDLVHYRYVLSEYTFFHSFAEFVAIRQEV
jgi:hypothetical protein